MKIGRLLELISEYNIPNDVNILSDSRWEYNETEVDSWIYIPEANQIIGIQFTTEKELRNKVIEAKTLGRRYSMLDYLLKDWIYLK